MYRLRAQRPLRRERHGPPRVSGAGARGQPAPGGRRPRNRGAQHCPGSGTTWGRDSFPSAPAARPSSSWICRAPASSGAALPTRAVTRRSTAAWRSSPGATRTERRRSAACATPGRSRSWRAFTPGLSPSSWPCCSVRFRRWGRSCAWASATCSRWRACWPAARAGWPRACSRARRRGASCPASAYTSTSGQTTRWARRSATCSR